MPLVASAALQAYHAVPTNRAAIAAFHYHVVNLWHRQKAARRKAFAPPVAND